MAKINVSMKGIVCEQYGGPEILKYCDVPKPKPKANEVIVKIVASSMNAGDWHLMRADPFLIRLMFGLFKPKCKVLGSDVAGVVEDVGSKVTEFKVGDEIYGDISDVGFRAFAEYAAVSEDIIALKPTSLTYDEAAAIPVAGVTALQAVRDYGKINNDTKKKVLINGASGGVGHFAIQIAKALGASEVTGVTSTKNIELVTSIGADKVIDYTKEDFSKNGEKYDVIIDAAGFRKGTFEDSLSEDGKYVFVGGNSEQLGHVMWKNMMGAKKVAMVMAAPAQKELHAMNELIEAGKVKPIIDRRYPLAEVPDAMRYLEEGHVRGKVVINIQNP